MRKKRLKNDSRLDGDHLKKRQLEIVATVEPGSRLVSVNAKLRINHRLCLGLGQIIDGEPKTTFTVVTKVGVFALLSD